MSSREQFEAWASDQGNFPFVVERSGDSYKFMATQNKWEVWQAATSALEAKCAALAAENAGLIGFHKYIGLTPKHSEQKMMEMKKPFIDDLIHSSEYYSVCGHISAATNRAIKAVRGDYSWLPETPATDAFLAEVRAQGVELFAREMHAEISEADAIEFAAQLRKGVQS